MVRKEAWTDKRTEGKENYGGGEGAAERQRERDGESCGNKEKINGSGQKTSKNKNIMEEKQRKGVTERGYMRER